MPSPPARGPRRRASPPAGRARAAADYPRLEVSSRAALRAWLTTHHATSRGVWVVAFKRHVAGKHVDAAAIAEEALAVGWIDSLPRKLDADRSMLLVTPRKPTSAWSRLNRTRVERLTEAGLMTEAGLAVVAAAKASGRWNALDAVEALEVPADLAARFATAPAAARRHFDAFPPSARRGILEWIGNAKRPETRRARIEETVTLAVTNQRANQWRPR